MSLLLLLTPRGAAIDVAGEADGGASATGSIGVGLTLAAGAGGAASSTSTAAVTQAAVAGSVGIASTTADLAVARQTTSTLAGTSSATAAPTAARPVSSTSTGSSTTISDIVVGRGLAASASGLATSSSDVVVQRSVVTAVAAGASTAAGAVTSASSLLGSSVASSSATAELSTFRPTAATSTGSSSVAADAVIGRALAIVINGVATSSGAVMIALPLAGVATAVAASGAALIAVFSLTGAGTGASTVSSQLAVALFLLTGTITGLAALTVALASTRVLIGASVGISTSVAVEGVLRTLLSSAEGQAAGSAAIGVELLLGTSITAGSGVVSASLTAPHSVSGVLTGVADVQVLVGLDYSMQVQLVGSSTSMSWLQTVTPLESNADGLSVVNGTLLVSRSIVASSQASSGVTAFTATRTFLVAQTSGGSVVSVSLDVARATGGTASGTSTVQNRLTEQLAGRAVGASTTSAVGQFYIVVGGSVFGTSNTTGSALRGELRGVSVGISATGVVAVSDDYTLTGTAVGKTAVRVWMAMAIELDPPIAGCATVVVCTLGAMRWIASVVHGVSTARANSANLTRSHLVSPRTLLMLEERPVHRLERGALLLLDRSAVVKTVRRISSQDPTVSLRDSSKLIL